MTTFADRLSALEKHLDSLTEDEYQELVSLVEESTQVWEPLPGPQREAYFCGADELFYGGQAGGGKSDLLIGLALTEHTESIIYRRESTQLVALIQRMTEVLGSRTGYNGELKIWSLEDRRVEFGSCKDVGDEIKYQGRPHSLKGFDEITHFTEGQYRFLCGWKRSVKVGERQRVVCTGNPPTDSDGDWVIQHWAPWLDPMHPHPAEPGELRWYVTFDNGVEQEVKDSNPVQDPATSEWIKPLSRTFIPSSVEDNPFLLQTGYKATLQALPEPLRSQMLKGDFGAGKDDDPWQVLPTEWVQAAMDRWVQLNPIPEMDSVGVDVARGGRDQTIVSRRHGGWFDQLIAVPGAGTPNGQTASALVIQYLRDAAPIHVDLIGVGSSVFDHLQENNLQVVGVNAAAGSKKTDSTGKLRMRNKRAEMWWELRECLDPKSRSLIALPPDPELKADLCAPRWTLTAQGVQIESKEDLIKRIGRSPDKGDAVVLANLVTEKIDDEEEYDDYFANEGRNAVTGY